MSRAPLAGARPERDDSRVTRLRTLLGPFFSATVAVAVVSAVAPVLQRLPHANLSLLFMTGVLIVAIRFGLWPSIYASVLSFLVFNFFFTAPVYTFSVKEEGDLATLVFFLLMASLTGNLAARMREAIANRERAVQRTAALQDLMRDVAGAATREQIQLLLAEHIAEHFGCETLVFLGDDHSGFRSVVSADKRTVVTSPDRFDELRAIVRGGDWTTWPLGTSRGDGLIAIRARSLSREERQIAAALASQAEVALERVSLAADLEEAKLITERERLRAALLSSVSHDLRTPLASIIGAASSLVAYEHTLAQPDKTALLQSVLSESERLDRYIQNLLDTTRLGQGPLRLHLDWVDLMDLISAAARRLRLSDRDLPVDTDVASDARLIFVHGDLIEQVLVNLLDNAARFSPPGGTIHIRARREHGAEIIEVSDDGPGIAERDRERIFDPFYRVHDADRKSGTGLGLSICRGIVSAHGGDVVAVSPEKGTGAQLRIRIPQPAQQPEMSADA